MYIDISVYVMIIMIYLYIVYDIIVFQCIGLRLCDLACDSGPLPPREPFA